MSVIRPDLQRLARDAANSRNWEWRKGMVLLWGAQAGNSYRLTDDFLWEVHMFCGGIPDLSDAQTIDAVLELVRDKRRDPMWQPHEVCHDVVPDWVIDPPSQRRQTLYNSYVSALVAALSRST